MISRKEMAQILAQDSWFSNQTAALQDALLIHAQPVSVEEGRWIYDVGEDASGIYGVLEGSVSTYLRMEDAAPTLVTIVGPGRIFGYAKRFIGGKRITTAVSRERGSLFYLPERGLEAIAKNQPDIWLRFAELSSIHLIAGFRLAVINRRPAPARLAAHLIVLLQMFAPRLDLPVTQDELAELSGLSRKTVNRTLAHLADLGILSIGYRSIQVHDPDGLRNRHPPAKYDWP